MPNFYESGKERILLREDVLSEIEKRFKGAELLRELADNDGVYLLETRLLGGSVEEFINCQYQRKGTFSNKIESEKTVLEKIYFVDNNVVWAEIIAELNDITGEWEDK